MQLQTISCTEECKSSQNLESDIGVTLICKLISRTCCDAPTARTEGAAATSVLEETGSGKLPFITKSGEMPFSFSYACNLHLFTKACNTNKVQMLLNMATIVILVIW